jgi:16S rRNA (guanine1207-N2)-methyltransferase
MTEHYYSEKQKSTLVLHKIFVPGTLPFEMYSASGIFSVKSVDVGTAVLLKYMRISAGASVADLGCGYGVVGIYILKHVPKTTITFLDTNTRALDVTQKNLKLHKLEQHASVIQSDIFAKVSETFDCIVTNPPYTAGRAVCFGFIEQSFAHLKQGGTLQLVCRRRKGGDVLEEKMNEIFGNVSVIGSSGGFRVYCSEKLSK